MRSQLNYLHTHLLGADTDPVNKIVISQLLCLVFIPPCFVVLYIKSGNMVWKSGKNRENYQNLEKIGTFV